MPRDAALGTMGRTLATFIEGVSKLTCVYAKEADDLQANVEKKIMALSSKGIERVDYTITAACRSRSGGKQPYYFFISSMAVRGYTLKSEAAKAVPKK